MAASRVIALAIFLGYWLDDGVSAAFLPANYQRQHAFQRFIKSTSCTDVSTDCPLIAMANMCTQAGIETLCPMSCNPSCQKLKTHGGLGVWRMHQQLNLQHQHLQHGGARYVKKHVGGGIFGNKYVGGGIYGKKQLGGGIFGVSATSGVLPTATISRRLQLNALTHGTRVPLAHRLAFSAVAPYSKLLHLGATSHRQGLRINKNLFARRFGTAGLLSTVGGCQDVSKKCVIMAAAGKCEKIPGFMQRHCRLSCKACVPGVQAPVHRMTKAIKHMQNASL